MESIHCNHCSEDLQELLDCILDENFRFKEKIAKCLLVDESIIQGLDVNQNWVQYAFSPVVCKHHFIRNLLL